MDPDLIIDLTTPEAQAEYAAFLARAKAEQARIVDFHPVPEAEPRNFGRRWTWDSPAARASDGRRWGE
ncbi:hypothetical protein ACWCYZ_39040 [Streptomyces virginiae]